MTLLINPIERPALAPKVAKRYTYFVDLINALNKKELTASFEEVTNKEIAVLNEVADDDPSLKKQINKLRSTISTRMMKELKYVPKGYYKIIWMSVGMSAFGLPFGVMFSVVLDSFAFIALGFPLGIPIGMAIGAGMDKKAAQEGRQLDISINM